MNQNSAESKKTSKVPYRERRAIKKHLIPRTLQRKRRRFKKLICYFLFFGLVFLIFITLSNTPQKPHRIIKQTPDPEKKTEEAGSTIDVYTNPLFVYSVKKGKISSCAIFAAKKDTGTLVFLTIDERTNISLLGVGTIEIKQLNEDFIDNLYASVANQFSYQMNGPLKAGSDYLNPEVLSEEPQKFIEALVSENPEIKVNTSELAALSSEVIPAPTRLSKAANQTVIALDFQKLNEAADIVFSGSFPKKEVKGSVVILNGSGKPASGIEAAINLINAGFSLKALRNAEKFDYLVTEVRTIDSETGKEIQKILGCGEVKAMNDSRDVADAVIIIGRDFISQKN